MQTNAEIVTIESYHKSNISRHTKYLKKAKSYEEKANHINQNSLEGLQTVKELLMKAVDCLKTAASLYKTEAARIAANKNELKNIDILERKIKLLDLKFAAKMAKIKITRIRTITPLETLTAKNAESLLKTAQAIKVECEIVLRSEPANQKYIHLSEKCDTVIWNAKEGLSLLKRMPELLGYIPARQAIKQKFGRADLIEKYMNKITENIHQFSNDEEILNLYIHLNQDDLKRLQKIIQENWIMPMLKKYKVLGCLFIDELKLSPFTPLKKEVLLHWLNEVSFKNEAKNKLNR